MRPARLAASTIDKLRVQLGGVPLRAHKTQRAKSPLDRAQRICKLKEAESFAEWLGSYGDSRSRTPVFVLADIGGAPIGAEVFSFVIRKEVPVTVFEQLRINKAVCGDLPTNLKLPKYLTSLDKVGTNSDQYRFVLSRVNDVQSENETLKCYELEVFPKGEIFEADFVRRVENELPKVIFSISDNVGGDVAIAFKGDQEKRIQLAELLLSCKPYTCLSGDYFLQAIEELCKIETSIIDV
jgi:hypothetical protein